MKKETKPKRARVQSFQTDLVSMTQQHHAQGATPAEIVKTYARTGMIPQVSRPAMPDIPHQSFHEMLNQVADAKYAFASLPATVRARFSNDPYQALRFVDDPKNLPEAIKLGIASPAAIQRFNASQAAKAANPPPEGGD